MELANLLIEISQSDLEASRVLHSNGLHSQSYFQFQQAVEKANKAWGLFNNIITEDELYKLQHDQLKIYRKSIVSEEKKIKDLIKTLEPHPKLHTHPFIEEKKFGDYTNSLNEGLRFIDSLRNVDLVEISASDLNVLIRELKKIENTKIKLPRNYSDKLKKEFEKLIDWIGNFNTPQAFQRQKELRVLLYDKDKYQELCDVLPKILQVMIDSIFIHYTFYFCAIITIQHSSLTRYPDEDKVSPLDIYDSKLPLVKKQQIFMDLFDKALIKFIEIQNPDFMPIPKKMNL
jgi:HEPN domain-containing protein